MSGEGEVLYFTTSAPAAHTGGQFVDNQGHGLPVQLLDASGNPLFTTPAAEADGIANPTVGKIGGYPHLYNGATWDRLREVAAADAQAAAGILASGGLLYNGATWDRARGSLAADANAATGLVNNAALLYNGATFDLPRNNVQGTLLASAARTAQTDSAIQTNYNARGVLLILNVTAVSGAGSLGVLVMAQDPVTGSANRQLNINGISAVATISVALGVHYPGQANSNAATIASSNLALPRTWFARVTVATADSMTYSLGYSYIL